MTEIQTTEGASPSLLPALAFIATQKNKATVTSDLRKIAGLMGFNDWNQVNWATLNAANVGAVFAKIEGAPATRNRALSVLKGIAKAAWRLELLSSETLARINDISGDKGTREITGRNIEAWELIALMRNCGEDVKGDKAHLVAAGIRDAAIIALAANTGARREEIAAIKRADMTDKGDVITIQMIGKRNKQRTVYVNNGALKALRAWLTITPTIEYLFTTINKGGAIGSERMTSVALHKMLVKRAEQAGLTNLSWHDFRRTFAGELLDMGEDISTVSQLMGHSNVTTTARYDRRPEAAREKAAKKISVPFFG